jgi:hypothetical protein
MYAMYTMKDQQIRAVLDEHWAASAAGDLEKEHDIYADNVVVDYPQSMERISGRQNIQALRGHHPSKPSGFKVRRIIGKGDLWITEYVTVYDGQHRVPTVSIMEFHDSKVVHETQYFAERFEPPAWRAQWVKVMTEMVEINQTQFDWNEIISKPVITADDKSIGHIDGIMETEFIVKQRLFNPHYYRIPRDSVFSYNHGGVKLKLSEEEVYKFKVSQPYKAVGGHTDYYT